MREYIIALKMKLPANVTPEQWVKQKIGSVNLAGVEVHYEEINMMEKVELACYIVNYMSHVLFSGLSNKSILSSISFDWICALSSVAPEVATVERSYSINYEIR